MRKVILYIAMSLDGYIADENNGIAFLENGEDRAYSGDYGYQTFIENIDTILWGYTTYHQVRYELSPDFWAYEKQISYVFTHREISDVPNIHFVNQDPVQFVNMLRKEDGKDIWICGGAKLISPIMKENIIDEYQISIMPTLLGNGIPLFPKMKELQLKLVKQSSENGVILTTYIKKA